MKSEIEVFIANVFLPVLESPNCPLERKSLVLEALRALCADPHLLTSIFLNYDCDFDAVNLYKTILHHLTSLAVRGRPGSSASGSKHKVISDDFKISVAGLEVLVVILQGFLKALNLPGGEDAIDEQRSKVRGLLQLDVGLAAKDKVQSTSSDNDLNSGEDIQIGTEDLALKIVDAFDKKQLVQQNFETGCIKFKLSFKQGLLFFIQNGFLSLDARDFARFFHENREKLDLTQVGEVFGKEPDASFVKDKGIDPEKGGEGFYIRVLHHYVNQLDFTDVKFDDAIRLFLSGFRLPGESQKVDRIMEKFAERYTLQNDDIFPSADTAFILAFAVIMLQTDLHNPNIKPEKKLTQEGFVKMNKGISVDGGDLPVEFLIEIYQSIKQRPFTLKEDDDARRSQSKKTEGSDINDVIFGSVVAEERKRERFKKESAVLFESTEKLFKKSKPSQGDVSSDFASSINPADVVKPMFDITWGPLLGSLSQIMEKAEDDSSIALSLNGFVYAVRIASHTNTTLARSTFMNALAKFTALGSMRELKPRNIECIRTLLSIAIVDGEHLEDSWVPVLQCISQLGRLIFVASGLDYDDNFLHNEKKSGSPRKTETKETEHTNSRVVLEAINEILIEKVFSASTKLSDKGVMHLIQSLVQVSRSEIEGDSKKDISGVSRASAVTSIEKDGKDSQNSTGDGPRVFSLQKLVEVADYNMSSRSRLSWAKIWGVMSNHFVAIGCHDNQNVSLFAIDALRQLSNKFLEKSELADFNFQRMFLKPFLDIMDNKSSLSDTREVILQCIDNMIRSKYDNIRSGWKIFFSILVLAANDSSEKNNVLGLRILQRLVDERLEDFCSQGRSSFDSEKNCDEDAVSQKKLNGYVDDFVGLVKASMAFITTTKALPPGVSRRALCHVACYADQISKGSLTLPMYNPQFNDSSLPGYTYEGLNEKEACQMMLWRPIFDGLASGMCSKATSRNYGVGCFVQRGSVMTVRAILLRHGHVFSANQWKGILQQSILPSIVIAVESDKTAVMDIVSESPNVSNLDFLCDPLPLPPEECDPDLLKFSTLIKELQGESKRELGSAELLVEACFADFRHGGNGDLRNAYKLLNKDAVGKNIDEPFPDSWVATTGPIALGMLTDFFQFFVINFPVEDVRSLWNLTVGQIQTWIVGIPFRTENSQSSTLFEALSRIGSAELVHLTNSLWNIMPQLQEMHRVRYLMGHLCESLAHSLSYAVDLEKELLAAASYEVQSLERNLQLVMDGALESEGKMLADEMNYMHTCYGKGRLLSIRKDEYPDGIVKIATVELESGSTLFCVLTPEMERHTCADDTSNRFQNEDGSGASLSKRDIMTKYVSPLRILCTSVFCLQQSFFALLDSFSVYCSEEEVSLLLNAVEKSRNVACEGATNQYLPSYFQEAYLMETGARVEEVQAAFSSDSGIGHVGRYEMYYLTQESSANNVLVRFLSLLYCPRADTKSNNWDTVLFAEPLLVARMIDVLQKFITSERSFGHKIDPNVWRTASDSGGKFAVHCTSFATIVVNILYTMVNFSDEQFERQKDTLFPILCSLISVQSEEIRKQVANVFITKVGNLLNKTKK
jgi:brefeldin A-inhibited guanine nucleotide-exchange protein